MTTMNASRPSIRSARRLGKTYLGAVGLLGALLPCSRSFAQAEAQKPAPNVLLLVDSSGSMEFTTDGEFPQCAPSEPNAPNAVLPNERSRWINLVEVLTGKLEGYSCWQQSRNTPEFSAEFSINGVAPYDFGYVNPYHRALSNGCTYGPGVLPPESDPYAWPDGAVDKFAVTGTSPNESIATTPGCAAFSQIQNGVLDRYKDMVRFGLMTFDARVSAATGVDGDYAEGPDGNWSYYLGGPSMGTLPDCAPTPQEVGARNAAAPPWEGRMVAFGPANEADNTLRNGWIQDVLLSTRPYGATPIAGQLDDARDFLWNDARVDPLNPGKPFGPNTDPNWLVDNCRKTILILLTDGEPNLDLRPHCGDYPDCPYEEPEAIVRALYNGTGAPSPSMTVETYVVGFALDEVTLASGTKSCASLDPLTDCSANPDNKRVQACCTLNKIAAEGGKDAEGVPRKAYFAENEDELKAIFAEILGDVIQVATRTMPVFSSPGGDAASRGYKFFSAFDPQPDPTESRLWEGVLERRRFVCSEDLVPELQEVDAGEGDDFAANLSSGAGPSRHIYSMVGANSANSMRPFITSDSDDIGTQTGNQILATAPADLAGQIPASALGFTATDDPCPNAGADACKDLILEHLVGLTNDAGETRCDGSDCQLLGGIFHSVPTVVPGRPADLLRDESYEAFVNEMGRVEAPRPSVLYTSSVDGFLHAFRLAPYPGSTGPANQPVDERLNNELWSFIPPAMLPVLHEQYPKTPQVLLDGIPIIKDVVATKVGVGDAAVVSGYERNSADAQAGDGFWRTVLVQGFGESLAGGGFFALDVTEPNRDQGPTFRWQLTRNASGQALFAPGGTPLITTVFVGADEESREVAVAVLPGGDAVHGSGSVAVDADEVTTADPAIFTTNRPVRQYTGALEARSLTIVRLDTGEVLRTFRPGASAPLFDSSVFTATNIPAPITGQPKAFPEITGAVADRIYVGDRDGRLWRVDVSSQDPDDWTMKIFYDAFSESKDGTDDETDSQPVTLAPVLSVDEAGDVTIAFSTGTQTLDTNENRVVSLTERLEDGEYVAHVNWIHDLEPGDRVTGPMVLFNSGLYYAVSRPPATTGSACDVGSSRVYGAHYIESDDYVAALAAGNTPDPKSGPARAPGGTALEIDDQAGLVFGLSLEAEPTCASLEEVITGNESFGYGEVRMSSTVKPGRYFLNYAASGNDSEPGSRGVLQVQKELEAPRLPVSFSSWAAVYE